MAVSVARALTNYIFFRKCKTITQSHNQIVCLRITSKNIIREEIEEIEGTEGHCSKWAEESSHFGEMPVHRANSIKVSHMTS